jgi:hypothetical protein
VRVWGYVWAERVRACVRIYIYIHIYIYIYISATVGARIYTHHIRAHLYTYVHIFAYFRTNIPHKHMNTHSYTHMAPCKYTYTNTCIHWRCYIYTLLSYLHNYMHKLALSGHEILTRKSAVSIKQPWESSPPGSS